GALGSRSPSADAESGMDFPPGGRGGRKRLPALKGMSGGVPSDHAGAGAARTPVRPASSEEQNPSRAYGRAARLREIHSVRTLRVILGPVTCAVAPARGRVPEGDSVRPAHGSEI